MDKNTFTECEAKSNLLYGRTIRSFKRTDDESRIHANKPFYSLKQEEKTFSQHFLIKC